MDNESKEMFQKILDRLDKMDSRLDKMDSRLDTMDSRLDKVDSRLDKVDSRLDKMDNKIEIIVLKQKLTAKKLDDLRLDVAVAERDTRRDIYELKDEMETVIEVLRMNEIMPR